MPDRVSRMSAGIAENDSTRPGRIYPVQSSSPAMGSHCSRSPNRMMSMSASQNEGSAWPSNATSPTMRSSGRPSCSAATIPSGGPISSAKPSPTRPSVSVTGRRAATRSHTGARNR